MPITHPHGGENISTAFLDTLGKEGPNAWHVTIQLCRCKVTFQIDTGAEVLAISEQVLRKIPGCRLLAPSKILRGPACEVLDVVGQFKGGVFGGTKHFCYPWTKKLLTWAASNSGIETVS